MKRIGLIVLIESERDQRCDSTRSNRHFYTILGHNIDQSIILFIAQRENLIYRNFPIQNFFGFVAQNLRSFDIFSCPELHSKNGKK